MPSVTLTTSNPISTRVLDALGKNQNLGRNANAAELKAWLAEQLKQMVFEQEDRAAKEAVATSRITVT